MGHHKFRKHYLKYTIIHGIIYAAKQERKKKEMFRRSCSKSLLGRTQSFGSDDNDSIYDAREYCHHKRLRRQETSMWSTITTSLTALSLQHQDGNQSPPPLTPLSVSLSPFARDARELGQENNLTPVTPFSRETSDAGVVCSNASESTAGAGAKQLQELEDRLCRKIENMESKQSADIAKVSADVAKLRVAVEAVLAHLSSQTHPQSPYSPMDSRASLV